MATYTGKKELFISLSVRTPGYVCKNKVCYETKKSP